MLCIPRMPSTYVKITESEWLERDRWRLTSTTKMCAEYSHNLLLPHLTNKQNYWQCTVMYTMPNEESFPKNALHVLTVTQALNKKQINRTSFLRLNFLNMEKLWYVSYIYTGSYLKRSSSIKSSYLYITLRWGKVPFISIRCLPFW